MAVKDKISEIEALEKELDNVSNEVSTLTKEQVDAVDHANKERLEIDKLQKSLSLKKKGLKKFMKDNDLSINNSTGIAEVSIPFDLKSFLHFVKNNLGYSGRSEFYERSDGMGGSGGKPSIARVLYYHIKESLNGKGEKDMGDIEKVFGKIGFVNTLDNDLSESYNEQMWDVTFDGQVKLELRYTMERLGLTHINYELTSKG